jgi:HAD superfamily hydrolase (TIGR01509 family)
VSAEDHFKAILLDLDGTLVDSLPALRAAYYQFLAAHGCTGTEEEFERWNGPPLAEVVAGLIAAHRIEGEAASLFEEYQQGVETAYVTMASLASGATELLDWLSAKAISVAVVTSAPKRLAAPLIDALNLSTRLGALVGGDEVKRGKPHPDGYLAALERLGVAAEHAIAVEDSATGVRAATAAGLRCLGVGQRRDSLTAAGALTVAVGLHEIREILGALLHGPGRVVSASRFDVRATGQARPLDSEVQQEVDQLWTAALAERPTITDGEIVAVHNWKLRDGALHVDVVLTRYRRFVAQRRGLSLGLTPMGVTGVTVLATGELVLGRRAANVTQSPGHWELVPSGGVERRQVRPDSSVDVAAQILEELEEELGIPCDRVLGVDPLGLIEDLDEKVIDLSQPGV